MDFLKGGYPRQKSSSYCYVLLIHAVREAVISIDQWVWEIKWSSWGFGSWRGEQLTGYGGGLIIWREWQRWSCLLPSLIIFSSISSVSCMCIGLLFLTSISHTDPDQFVYKTRPPKEQPDMSPDVMMNSYLGLWPLRWHINYLGHGHLIFLIHIDHKCFYFLFHFKQSTHKKHAMVEALLPGGFQSWIQWYCLVLNSRFIRFSTHLIIWELQQ